jgi:hypothetical protein
MKTVRMVVIAITGAVLLVLTAHGPSPAQTVDFEALGERESQAPRNQRRTLIESRQQLWEGRVNRLMFETAITRGTLVWASVDGTQLHVSTGQQIGLYPGDIRKQFGGRILSLDVNRMPHLRNRILISVTYWTQNRIVTDLLSFNVQSRELATFHSTNMAAIRPLNNFLYGQSYDPFGGWATDVFRLSTTSEGYQWDREVKVPAGARLLHMERLPGGHVSYIKDDGTFVVSKGPRITRSISEGFGGKSRFFGQYNPREDTRRSSVRMPPQFIAKHNLIAVAKNNVNGAGVDVELSTGEEGAIELFRWRRGSIVNRFTLGPVPGRILDIEISGANPSQLLWLRRVESERVVLEMIDLSDQFLR